jgi:HAD superfamily phosphoserine phosphatase-like hydrolase
VLFDVDSTLSPDEGIDELAGWLGKKAEVEALTSKAMNGDLAFEDAMRQRLQAMSPCHYDVQTMLSARPARITSGSQILISKLRRNGSEVFLVSGGFEQMVGQIADAISLLTAWSSTSTQVSFPATTNPLSLLAAVVNNTLLSTCDNRWGAGLL